MPKYDTVLIRNAKSSDFGGAERYPVILAQELMRLGYKPLILSQHATLREFANTQEVPNRKSPFLKLQNFYGKNVALLPFYFLWQTYLTIRYYLLFRSYSAKSIHLHSRDDFIAGTIAGSWLGCNIIWSDHADLKHILKNTQKPLKNPIGKWILKLSKKATAIITISQYEYGDISKQVPKNHPFWQKIIVVHNGITDRYQSYYKPKKDQIDHNNYIFANVGRMVSDKGVAECIEAFKKIHYTHPKTELWLIGDGNQRTKFIKLANGHPLIKFFGYQNDPLALLSQADCVLAPSYHEGLGMSIIEASMMRKTIIASQVGGIPEIIINNVNGLLVPPRDSTALAKAMEKIITNSNLAHQLARRARQTYKQKFDLAEIFAKDILPLYNINTDVKTAN